VYREGTNEIPDAREKDARQTWHSRPYRQRRLHRFRTHQLGTSCPSVEFPPQSLLPSQFDMTVNGLHPESELFEKLSNASGSLPTWIRDPMYNHIIKKVNNYIFKSAPAGAPLPEEPNSWKFSVVGDMGNGTKSQVRRSREPAQLPSRARAHGRRQRVSELAAEELAAAL